MTFCRTLLLSLLLSLMIPLAVQAQQTEGSLRYFEVARINPGLGAADGIMRDTPQAAMESFLYFAQRGDWDKAAHLLDLSPVDITRQPADGPQLARMLNDVIERGMILDWSLMPDRPDGLDAFSTSETPLAGEPRRSIRLSLIELDGRDVAVRLSRYKSPAGDPVWLFASQTVENIPAMHEIYGPTEFERMLPGFLQQTAFWTLAWWEIVFVPLVALAAITIAWAAYNVLGRLALKTSSFGVPNILRAIRLPFALMVFVATFAVVRQLLFTFSGPVNAIAGALQTALLVIALAMIAVRGVDALLDQLARRNLEGISDEQTADERDLYTNISAARRLAIVIAFILGIALVLIQLNLTQTLGFALLASAGVLSLIIAFAARQVLSDIMASLQIAFTKSARIGDAVLYEDQWCYVEKIGFTYVQLRSWDNRRLIVPVSAFVSTTFENWTKTDASLIKPVLLHLDHRADVEKLRKPFNDFVDAEDDILDKDDCKVQVIDQDAAGMHVRFYISAADPTTAWDLHCKLREHMLEAISKLEAAAARSGRAYLPREREVILSDARKSAKA